jgi:hypothetical protein
MDSALIAASALARLRTTAARFWLDFHLPSSELPTIAVAALESGLDSTSLRVLAGELHPSRADSGPIFESALEELGIIRLSQREAVATLAQHYAEQILSDAVTPFEGARAIWDIMQRCWEDKELWQRYSIFIGLASDWDDYPPHRSALEQAIRDEARKLLEQFPEPGPPESSPAGGSPNG